MSFLPFPKYYRLVPRDAMLARYMLSSCVRPSIRQSVRLSVCLSVTRRYWVAAWRSGNVVGLDQRG